MQGARHGTSAWRAEGREARRREGAPEPGGAEVDVVPCSEARAACRFGGTRGLACARYGSGHRKQAFGDEPFDRYRVRSYMNDSGVAFAGVVDARSLAAGLEVISDGIIGISGREVAECRDVLE